MTIESEIAGLTQATTDLLTAVNVRKSALDQRVTDATTQATSATNSATNAAGSASTASGFATTATNKAIEAQGYATQAAASAASASALVLGAASGLPSIAPSLNLDFANSKTVDPRITFSRASTATYYDGKTVAKAEENLLTYSQEFDNAVWFKQGGSTVTPNTISAPDGTLTADTVTLGGSQSGIARFSVTQIGVVYTFSMWVKSGTRTSPVSIVNSAATVLGTYTPTADWQRVVVTYTASDAAIYPVFATGTETLHIWGAQLEQRSQVTAYTPTTTSPITNYIPALQTAAAGVPRIDHDPITGECKGLLIEEQRTNLLTYSEQFDTAAWSSIGTVTKYSNQAVAPDGTLSADRIVFSTPFGSNQLFQNSTFVSGTTYTCSVWMRVVSGSAKIKFGLYDGTIQTEYVTLTDKWQRFVSTKTATSNSGRGCWLYPETTGDAVDIQIWGAQLEVGAFPTSYIPTQASQVTRSADSASMTGSNFSSWYRQDEGTFFAEYLRSNGGSGDFGPSSGIVSFTDNNLNDRIILSNNGAALEGQVRSSGTFAITGSVNHGIAVGGAVRCALSYKAADYARAANGATPGTATTNVAPPAASNIQIGRIGLGNYQNGHIKKIAFYPKALPAYVQALTA